MGTDFRSLLSRIRSRYRREISVRFVRRLQRFEISRPIISFTFDDFPRSAATTGGAILSKWGARGTYYLSFGLTGAIAPTGPIIDRSEVRQIYEHGHELGCHTFGHDNAWETPERRFSNSLDRNRHELSVAFPGKSFMTFSYPISSPNPAVKRIVESRFSACRGGGQRFNCGVLDRNYLAAYFLEKADGNLARVAEMIDKNREAKGWLIFATHDVDQSPTPYGCTPGFFEAVVQYAVGSGAQILPVIDALTSIFSAKGPQVLSASSAS
jgi:peptidoglycan/xylan/chitin deacetylase (PgdA/CDA1 family)